MTSETLSELGPDTMVGSYRLVRELGHGGMGTVFEGRHVVLPRRAAVKVMHPELRSHPGMATRIALEASILEDIHHPGVVRVYDCGVLADHRPWIAMQLVEGECLTARLLRRVALAPREVIGLLAQTADVLAAVHAGGVTHRDLKPDNILLTPNDRAFPLRVIDWGVARLGPIGSITVEGLTPGTPTYMAPEQASGRNVASPCDVYSLGVIAYEVLAGHPPFHGRSPVEVACMHVTYNPPPLEQHCTAPAALCALVHSMLNKEPSRRPSAAEIRQLARTIARDLGDDAIITRAERSSSGRHVAIDPIALEFGTTEVVPAVPEAAARRSGSGA